MINNPVVSNEPPQPPRPAVSSKLILWLVALSLGMMFLPLYLISTTIKENNVPLATQLAVLQATLTVTPPPNPEEKALKATLEGVQNQINALDAIRPTLVAGHTDWAVVITVIANYDSGRMALTGVAQSGNQILVTGQAGEEATVMAYADMLRTSQQFDRVVLQSITSKVLPTATPLPVIATTGTPTVPTLTPAPQVNEFHPAGKVVEFTIAIDRKVNG
jgi:hypothetical protein